MTMQLFLIDLLASCFIGYLGRNKKLGFWGFFFASLLLPPLMGVLLLIVAAPAPQAAAPKPAPRS